jgi:hypothetical protein
MPSIEEVKSQVQTQIERTDEGQGQLQAVRDLVHEIQAECGAALAGTSNSGADELLGMLGFAMEQVEQAQNALASARSTGESLAAAL